MLAVIGGSGLNQLTDFFILQRSHYETPFGTSVEVSRGHYGDESRQLLFMPRHGDGHHLPPHRINYRANVWALKALGATHIVATNAVGGIRSDTAPGQIIIPDQIIDYTYGREHTYFCGDEEGVEHIDFTFPYAIDWRKKMIKASTEAGITVITEGVYGCAQGPRLETAAEIQKLKRDGCDVIGMTGMPEAALARELGLKYGAINLVVNWGAGLSDEVITMESIMRVLEEGMARVNKLIQTVEQNY